MNIKSVYRWGALFVIKQFTLVIIALFMLASCIGKEEERNDNSINAYRAIWWHIPNPTATERGWGRPDYGVANIDNGELTLRHAILEGRELGDYRLPYYPITSFVSIISKTAEIAHQSSITVNIEGKAQIYPFRCGDQKYTKGSMSNKRIEEGFELARLKGADILKVTNKGSGSPFLMEHFFVVQNNNSHIPVYIKTTNTSDQPMQNVVVNTLYTQDFNWNFFGASDSKSYQRVEVQDSGKAKSFFAFSSGMERGYEFCAINDCDLFYSISPKLNTWKVTIQNTPATLEPGESMVYSYRLHIIDEPLKIISKDKSISIPNLDLLNFTALIPSEVKTAPINLDKTVSILDVIKNLEKPKARGFHRVSGFPKALTDLELLKEWGGNLSILQAGPISPNITNIGNTKETRQIIKHGYKLGMEMYLTGIGYYTSGEPPKFDQYFEGDLNYDELPDSYGTDEDHYYWGPIKPTIDFHDEFGIDMSAATQEQKVSYWSRCFVDKWQKTLDNIHNHDPKGNIWFYTPSPGVANIDPLDYNNQFMLEISKFGDLLTVFPFYYGDDYSQIEYMMQGWKEAGAARAIFLPGGPTYAKPSQYFRAITAARRGGADGACAFAFSINENLDHEWRWKSVMLASHANFPTPELDAYCFIEKPADLIEALAVSEINVITGKSDADDLTKKLDVFLPGKVKRLEKLPENQINGQIYVVVGENASFEQNKWAYDIQHLKPGKGVIQMSGSIVRLNGADKTGLQNAKKLFLRFTELIKAENNL